MCFKTFFFSKSLLFTPTSNNFLLKPQPFHNFYFPINHTTYLVCRSRFQLRSRFVVLEGEASAAPSSNFPSIRDRGKWRSRNFSQGRRSPSWLSVCLGDFRLVHVVESVWTLKLLTQKSDGFHWARRGRNYKSCWNTLTVNRKHQHPHWHKIWPMPSVCVGLNPLFDILTISSYSNFPLWKAESYSIL